MANATIKKRIPTAISAKPSRQVSRYAARRISRRFGTGRLTGDDRKTQHTHVAPAHPALVHVCAGGDAQQEALQLKQETRE